MISILVASIALAAWEKLALAAIILVVLWLACELLRCPRGRRHKHTKEGKASADSTVKLTPEEAEELWEEAEKIDREEAAAPMVCTACGHCCDADACAVFCEHCGSSFHSEEIRQQLRWDQGEISLAVGRDPSANVPLFDDTSSRHHARILFRNGSLTIEDLGASNHTWINGRQILGPTLLCPGDNVRFGRDERTYDHIIASLADEIRRRSAH